MRPIFSFMAYRVYYCNEIRFFDEQAVLDQLLTGAYKRNESHDPEIQSDWLHDRYRSTLKPVILNFSVR